LYQSGYLTIAAYDEELNEFSLDYPNEEVRASFADTLLEHYARASASDMRALTASLPRAFIKGDIEGAMNALVPFIAGIPYDLAIRQERYYQTIFHLIFRMLGLYCQPEVRIAAGRIDSLVETKNYVYCFEFKLTGTTGCGDAVETALRQIDSKDYLVPWQGGGKQLFKIGVAFDQEKRSISSWKAVSV
jgi:hypothetical protein